MLDCIYRETKIRFSLPESEVESEKEYEVSIDLIVNSSESENRFVTVHIDFDKPSSDMFYRTFRKGYDHASPQDIQSIAQRSRFQKREKKGYLYQTEREIY